MENPKENKKNTSRFSGFKKSLRLSLRSFGLHGAANFFIQNLAVLVEAGLPITSAMESVYSETKSWRMRSVLRDLMASIDAGLPLAEAIRREHIASSYTLALIRLGERSGNLSNNLKVAATQNEKEAHFRSRVRSALFYSFFVLTLAIAVGVGVAWYVLPKMARFFEELDSPLPRPTQLLLAFGDFLQSYGAIFLPITILGFCILFYFLFSFPKTKFLGHTILFHVPLIHRLILETEVARFGFLSGSMVRAGVPLGDVFELLPGTTTFRNYQKLYEHIHERVVDGVSFRVILSEYRPAKKLLPVAVRQMIAAAEQSGTLSDSLIKIGEMYEVKVDNTSRNIPTFLEPLLLLMIGVIVGVLALAILMPIYQLGFAL